MRTSRLSFTSPVERRDPGTSPPVAAAPFEPVDTVEHLRDAARLFGSPANDGDVALSREGVRLADLLIQQARASAVPTPAVEYPHGRAQIQKAQLQISAGAPHYQRLDASTPEAEVDRRLTELEADLNHRARRYSAEAEWRFMAADGNDDGLGRTYHDLGAAFSGDVAALKGWQNLSPAEKLDLYNRISREAEIEVKYNVSLVYGDKPWSRDELDDLDAGLAKIPRHVLLNDEKLNNIRRWSGIKDNEGEDVAAWALPNGDIEFTDFGVNSTYRWPLRVDTVTEVILHEVGHHFDDENKRWKEFMALSGWHDVGDSGAYAATKDGEVVRGKDLGIADDPDGEYKVTRRYGRTFAYRTDAKFADGEQGNYARSNPYDDFAETFMQFFVAPDVLKSKSPEKYEFIKRFLEESNQAPEVMAKIDDPLRRLIARIGTAQPE